MGTPSRIYRKLLLILTIFIVGFLLYNLKIQRTSNAEKETYYTSDARMETTSPDLQCKMTFEPKGRLGNNMFQHIALMKLAKLNGCQPIVQPKMIEYLNKCFVPDPTLKVQDDPGISWESFPVEFHLLPEYKLLFKEHKNYKFVNWPHDFHYLEGFKDVAKRQFMFIDSITETRENFLSSVKKKYELKANISLIGIHIRRTDYTEHLGKKHCAVAPPSYLSNAIKWMVQRHPNPVFIVASDDLTEAKSILERLSQNITGLKFEMVPFGPCETMAIISKCDHVIITQGTFGFWSAYLSEGDVVYYTNFCYNNTRLIYIYENVHMPHWHPLTANVLPETYLNQTNH